MTQPVMMDTSGKSWYAVHTRPRWEKKVAGQLAKKRLEYYCPLNKVQRQWSDRKKIILEPLFTSYVFVRLSETEHLPVLQTDGVLSFVYWLKKPAVIQDAHTNVWTPVRACPSLSSSAGLVVGTAPCAPITQQCFGMWSA